MASSDNSIESGFENSWGFHSAFDNSWVSQLYARDTHILTKALQHSISNTNNHFLNLQTQSLTSSGAHAAASETETVSKRTTSRNGPLSSKITKRKSRASKRSATTFIMADPDNFRQMVQQVTGIQFSGGPGFKPNPKRLVSAGLLNRVPTGCVLPTLDTSAFFLDNQVKQQQQQEEEEVVGLGLGQDFGEFGPGLVGGSDFDGFVGFPTLESWN